MSYNEFNEPAWRMWRFGFSVIPLIGKKPNISTWLPFQQARADEAQMMRWQESGQFATGIGVVCGTVSNVVVIDLDGLEAVDRFKACWPAWCDTLEVATGSGQGAHLYYRPDVMPPTARHKGYELRSDGCYVVAPPSIHPVTQARYQRANNLPIKRVTDMFEIVSWIRNMGTPLLETLPQDVKIQRGTIGAGALDRLERRKRAYFDTAMSAELERVTSAPMGARNNTLFYAVLRVARYSDAAGASPDYLAHQFLGAARSCGLPDSEALATIESALRIAKPKDIEVR